MLKRFFFNLHLFIYVFFHSPKWIHEWPLKQLNLKSSSISHSAAEGTKQTPYKFRSANLSIWSCRSVCLEHNPHTSWLVNTPEAPCCTNIFKDATQDTQLSLPCPSLECQAVCGHVSSFQLPRMQTLTLHFSQTYWNRLKVVILGVIASFHYDLQHSKHSRSVNPFTNSYKTPNKSNTKTKSAHRLSISASIKGKTCTGPSYPCCLIWAELETSTQLSTLPPTPHHPPHLILLPKHMSLTCNHDPGSQYNSEFVGYQTFSIAWSILPLHALSVRCNMKVWKSIYRSRWWP